MESIVSSGSRVGANCAKAFLHPVMISQEKTMEDDLTDLMFLAPSSLNFLTRHSFFMNTWIMSLKNGMLIEPLHYISIHISSNVFVCNSSLKFFHSNIHCNYRKFSIAITV